MVSFKSSLILFLTVITALTLNFTGFSAETKEVEEDDGDDDDEEEEEEPFSKSSLIVATGNFAAFLTLTTLLLSKGTKKRVWLKSDDEGEEGTNKDLSSNEEPMICFVRAMFVLNLHPFWSFFFSLSRTTILLFGEEVKQICEREG